MRYVFYYVAAIAAVIIAGCSSSGGFGGPGLDSRGQQGVLPGAVPGPTSSVSPKPSGSSSPASSTAVVLNGAVEVAGATARLAFDGGASDSQKAPRLLVLTFALKNGLKNSIGVRKLSLTGSGDLRPVTGPMTHAFMPNQNGGTGKSDLVKATGAPATPSPVIAAISVDIPSGRQSDAHVVAVTIPETIAAHKQVAVDFVPAKGKALASVTIDVPDADISSTPLDVKSPKGAPSIDSVDVGAVEMPGPGLHYLTTFAVTNPGTTAATIVNFTIAPPKGPTAKVALPLVLQPRTTSSFITLVLPYAGKTLPSGKYAITANGAAGAIASGSGNIL